MMEPLRAYLVDDEYLALKRLSKLLVATQRVQIIGSTTDPIEARNFLARESVDLVFLDIQMPEMTAFELLEKLPTQPPVIFTTAYDQYALKAFEVNSVDYLLKPVDPQHLDRALRKIEQRLGSGRDAGVYAQFQSVVPKLIDALSREARRVPDRICSRVGERILLIDLSQVTHFYSKDKLTYASIGAKQYVVDYTISELEQALGAKDFVRIHRATLINLLFIEELHRWFGGRMMVRMKDKNRTELTVARNYARLLKERLGLY